jgi:hypothetical protein
MVDRSIAEKIFIAAETKSREEASMSKVRSFVVASIALMLGSVSASAERQVHGGDVARVLAGRNFNIECVDGTHGRGQVSNHGAISVSYRRANNATEQSDHANVKVQGVEICLAWKQFGGGGNGCYPVFERAANRFRLGSGPLWCDISPR